MGGTNEERLREWMLTTDPEKLAQFERIARVYEGLDEAGRDAFAETLERLAASDAAQGILARYEETADAPGRVAIKCPMCEAGCKQCLGSGVVHRPLSSPVAKYDELEMVSKAASLMVQAMGSVAQGTIPIEIAFHGPEVPLVWTIDTAIHDAWDSSQQDIRESDIDGILWALGQAIKGLMEKRRVIGRGPISYEELLARRAKSNGDTDTQDILLADEEGKR